MTGAGGQLAERAAELRSAFDRAFAAPVRIDAAVRHDLLAVRVGSEPCAIRLADIAGIAADQNITRVPGSHAALLGIAAFRGTLLPAYNLRTLLGLAGKETPRWLVIAAAAPIALAFDAFEGHLRVFGDAIIPQQPHARTRGYAPEFIRTAAGVRPVLHLPSVVAAFGKTERREILQSED
jgi:chemotaxis signal transduction protein